MAKVQFDWDAIAQDFITSQFPMTMKALAKKYNGTREHITRMAQKEHWRARRIDYWLKVKSQSEGLAAQSTVEKAKAFDDRMFALANWLIGQAVADRKNGAKTSEVAWTLQRAQVIGKIATGELPTGGEKKETFIAEWGKNEIKELQAGTVVEPTISEEKPQ
jgi:hypothetical protein